VGEAGPELVIPLKRLRNMGLPSSVNLVGHYGTAWQNQKKEFDEFPGAILGTTNCVLIPKESYQDRMFTCGIAKLSGVTYIDNRDFSAVIEKAKAMNL
jgi:hydroxylamine reductase